MNNLSENINPGVVEHFENLWLKLSPENQRLIADFIANDPYFVTRDRVYIGLNMGISRVHCITNCVEGTLDNAVAKIDETHATLKVMKYLDTGVWGIERNLPHDDFTDSYNERNRWTVQRKAQPFCDEGGIRFWNGKTALEALEKASKDLQLPLL